MIDAAVILLLHAGRLPWLALLIPLRDLVALIGTPIVIGRGYEFQVNLLGKTATWLLYASLGVRDGHARGNRLAALDLLGRPRARVRLARRVRAEGAAGGAFA